MNENTTKLVKIAGIFIGCVFGASILNELLQKTRPLPESFVILVYALIGLGMIGAIVAILNQSGGPSSGQGQSS
jgi:uncharacterized membrane protein AbrB (regulator of aidB expression)|tara:strand:+ start:707 stop:928 length:222 start_codon:yes stop_codon:yes gene_type:complete